MRRLSVLALSGAVVALTLGNLWASQARAEAPLDLWTAEVLDRIRDRSTLNYDVRARVGYWDVFYDSEIEEAIWGDSGPPYELHYGDNIRIHGYLAAPASGGPYPALVIGHGHGGSASRELAQIVAGFGYVALSISGPNAGMSQGGPGDTEQGWISVEEVINEPSPSVGYLYHYAYAGMRGLTLLESLAQVPGNPFRIDGNRLGVMGASMGGQFTYYINGVDDRVKAAVGLAVAGDWHKIAFYPGAWLYHGLYYYTRDGLPSGQDYLNTVSDLCSDPTMYTFLDYSDPIKYAPTQHGPLLTIIGTHDQYFTVPGVNTTYDQVQSASTNPRFLKRIMLAPNGKHGIIDGLGAVTTAPALLDILYDIDNWLKYSFSDGPAPAETPTVTRSLVASDLVFQVSVIPGSTPIRSVDLHYATQIDTFPSSPCDFASIRLSRKGDFYEGSIPLGTIPQCGPAVTSDNVLYFATVRDSATVDGGFTVTSKMYYGDEEMRFCTSFVPLIEHFPRDSFPVQPPPVFNCTCSRVEARPGIP